MPATAMGKQPCASLMLPEEPPMKLDAKATFTSCVLGER